MQQAHDSSVVCNCGYGHGETVKEVVEVVKRVSVIDFPARRLGRFAPAIQPAIAAKAERAPSACLAGSRANGQSRRDRAPGARLGAPAA